MKWFKITILLAILFLPSLIFAQTYTQSDSIPFRISTMANGWLANWDSVRVALYLGGTLIDTTKLTNISTGVYAGKHSALTTIGGYSVHYLAYYGANISADDWFFSVVDTLAFQGSASGLTATQIWQHDVSGYSTAGYAGTYLRNSDCQGVGGDSLQIWASIGGTMWDGVIVTVKNLSGTIAASAYTSSDGHVTFNLPNGTYRLYPYRPGVDWDSTYWQIPLTASGRVDTVSGEEYIFGSGELITVSGYTRTYGFKKTDRVTITFSTIGVNLLDTTSGVFIDKIAETVYSDTGYFQVELIPSVNLVSKVRGAEEDSIKYNVQMYAPGRTIFSRQGILIPRGASVQLKDLLSD